MPSTECKHMRTELGRAILKRRQPETIPLMSFERGNAEIELHEVLGEIAFGAVRGASNPVTVLSDVHADRMRALTRRAAIALPTLSGPAASVAALQELLQAMAATLDAYAVVRNMYYGGVGAAMEVAWAEQELQEAMDRLTALFGPPRPF